MMQLSASKKKIIFTTLKNGKIIFSTTHTPIIPFYKHQLSSITTKQKNHIFPDLTTHPLTYSLFLTPTHTLHFYSCHPQIPLIPIFFLFVICILECIFYFFFFLFFFYFPILYFFFQTRKIHEKKFTPLHTRNIKKNRIIYKKKKVLCIFHQVYKQKQKREDKK